jgi:uncharacterized phiE125 gp8 family phage protein
VQVADVLSQSRIYSSDADNALLTSYITVAREWLETTLNRQFMQAQWLMTLDQFPGRTIDEYRPPGWRYGIIRLPKAPLVSVDSVCYVDAGTLTLTYLDPSLWQVSTHRIPGLLAPARYQVWPIADPLTFEAVQIAFTCGHPTAAAVPARVKMAITLLVAHLYENREATADVALNQIPYGLLSMVNSLAIGERV